MSAKRSKSPERTLTVDDVRRRAEEVRDLTKAEARKVMETDSAQLVAYAVLGVLVVASLTYYLGTRKCARRETGAG